MQEPIVTPELPDFDKLWNYGLPAATEAKFRALMPCAEAPGNEDYCLQLRTQIARTYSLRGEFDEAHRILDDVENQLTDELVVARIRYLLERGRTWKSAGTCERACSLFHEAWELARANGEDFYAIDAAHMMGASTPTCDRLDWNAKAMEVAEASPDPHARRWLGALYNNSGMAHLDAGRFEHALECFRRGVEFRETHGGGRKAKRIAKWCVAHTLRRMDRIDEALRMQRELEIAWSEDGGDQDGFVFEEIAECLLWQGEDEQARAYFKKALPLLEKIRWIADGEPDRLARIRRRAG